MRWVVIILVLAVGGAAGLGWRKAMVLQQENTSLRIQIEELKQQAAAAADEREQSQNAELQKLRAENQELVKLRGEISQLRMGAKETEKLRAELSAMRSQNQQLQAQAVAVPAPPTNPAPEQFPRQSWTFSGYASPESALVSAIWAMREGKPQAFLDSLSPEEQQRMAQTWQGKSEEEIAAKHQGDVGNIQGLRILNRTPVSQARCRCRSFLKAPIA